MTEFRPPDPLADRHILLLEAKRYIETDAMPSDAQPTDEKRFKADEDSFFKNLATLAKVLKEVDNA